MVSKTKPPAVKLTHGIREGQLTHISDVEKGLQCGCMCPCCDTELVARKGHRRTHHFAHYNAEPCVGAIETALHMISKEILASEMKIWLPAVKVIFDSYRKPIEISEGRWFDLDSVQLEKRYGKIVPDLIATISGRELLIEVFVTQRVEPEKLGQIRRADVSVVEIDLSKVDRELTRESIRDLVVGDAGIKNWLFNSRAASRHAAMMEKAVFRKSIQRGFAVHVDDCPIRARVWRGKPYANVVDDCLGCDHALEVGENMSHVRCDG